MLKTNKLKKVYMDGAVEKVVLNNINITISSGEFITILGPSGSGKTTLLNVLSGIDVADFGEVYFEKSKLPTKLCEEMSVYRSEKTGFIFQNYNLISVLNVYENIKIGFDLKNSKDKKIVESLIKDVGLEDEKFKLPNKLSGGQKQRVAIARALAKEPKILFCDEPTGALDEKTGKTILKLLQELNKKGLTIVMVTHNPNISEISSRSIYFKDGCIVGDKKNSNPKNAADIGWS